MKKNIVRAKESARVGKQGARALVLEVNKQLLKLTTSCIKILFVLRKSYGAKMTTTNATLINVIRHKTTPNAAH